MTGEQLVKALLAPSAYGPEIEKVEFLQTHISWLFFAGDRVYKVKKPVRFDFLDYSTLERRHEYCREEVRLNQPLAPGVYRRVVPITRRTPLGVEMDGKGEPVEWAVEMERLPAERMLDRMLEQSDIDNSKLDRLATVLSNFHRESATGPGIDEFGRPARLRELVLGNLQEAEPFGDELPQALREFLARSATEFVERHTDLLERRVRAGRIREGHGDLHAGNICFSGDTPVIYDRIEFHRGFRCGDVAADLAFLLMDLDHRGFRAFGKYLAYRYGRLSSDIDLEGLLPFYKAYRATVRGKVACLTGRWRGLRRRARSYFQLAVTYHLPPALILMCGLPASGKSWAAKRIGGLLGAVLLRSDVRRKKLAGVPSTARTGRGDGGTFGKGLYSADMTRRTYESLRRQAEEEIADGRTVIVDATFSRRADRHRFLELAESRCVPVYVVHRTASEEATREHLRRRELDRNEPSDADWNVYRQARDRFHPPDEIPADRVVASTAGEDELDLTERVLVGMIGT